MFSALKKVFTFFFKIKKYLFLISFFSFIIFFIRFPWSDMLEKQVRKFQQKSPSARQIQFDDLEAKFFPPGVTFKGFSFFYGQKKVDLDSFKISLDVKRWLAFKKAFKILLKKEDSVLAFNFRTEKVKSQLEEAPSAQKLYFVKGFSRNFHLDTLNQFLSGIHLTGLIESEFFFKGSAEDIENIQAGLDLKGKNLVLSKSQLNTLLGPLSLPQTKWRQAEIDLKVREGELLFEKIAIGQPGDQLLIQLKGSSAFEFVGSRFKISSYNLELQIDLDKDLPFPFLDLIFGAYKEDKRGFDRYSLRLIGQGSDMPKMEKLEKFSFSK